MEYFWLVQSIVPLYYTLSSQLPLTSLKQGVKKKKVRVGEFCHPSYNAKI